MSDGRNLLSDVCYNRPLPEPNLRLLCHDGEFDDLLGDLALHRLDIVLSGSSCTNQPQYQALQSLDGLLGRRLVCNCVIDEGRETEVPRQSCRGPCIVADGAYGVRARIDTWFEQAGIRPRVGGAGHKAHCSRPLAPAGWVCSRPQCRCLTNCWHR